MATALGITGAGALIQFDAANPSTIVSEVQVTGLASGDSIVGLDFRPATGQLYGLGSGSRLYTINPTTGAAAQVGADGAFTLNGTSFGFDFNPVPDRVRVTSDADQNLRLNPGNGGLAATDGTLAFAAGDPNAGANPNIIASAYTNSFGGSTATTLYNIDSTLDALVIQNPPNSGTLNTVGSLGFDVQAVGGFDILSLSGGGNQAYAALTSGGNSGFYSINLTTGAATLIGSIGSGATQIVDLTIVPEITPTAVLYGIDDATDNLVRVNSNNPATIISSIPITGLNGAETIVGLDFRPATGQLYGLTSASRLYTINTATGAATQVGADGAFTLDASTSYGFDFNPVPDRVRVTSTGDQNLRLNPNDGTLAATDGTLAFAVGDANAANNPNVVASAYTNSFAGATATTLYNIDSALDVLVSQNPPNSGTLNTVGSLGIDVTAIGGFDILSVGGTNVGYAALSVDGVSSALYTVDLATGALTQVGSTAIGGTTPLLFRALTVAPAGSFSFSAPTFSVSENGGVATITVTRTLGSEGLATVRVTSSDGTATSPGDYGSIDRVLIFAPGETSRSFQVPIVNDSLDESDETLNLTLTGATGGAVLGAEAAAVLTIVDDDSSPVAADDTYSTPQGTALVIAASGVLANDTDADSDPLTAEIVTSPANGTLALNADGSFTYTPAAGFSGTDSFTYRANDGSQSGNTATVNLTVTPVNAAPVVPDSQTYLVTSGQVLASPAPGVLAGATDAEGSTLTAVLVTPPTNGTLVLNPDGSFTYTPAAGFVGTDTFTVRASDGAATSNLRTVSLTVTAPPPIVTPPVAVVAPRIVTLLRFGRLFQRTSLVLQFDRPIDANAALLASNYTILRPNGRVVGIRGIRVLESSNRVVLTLANRIPLFQRHLLIVNAGAGGLRSASGVPLDGTGTNRPGTNFVSLFGRSNFAGPDRNVPR